MKVRKHIREYRRKHRRAQGIAAAALVLGALAALSSCSTQPDAAPAPQRAVKQPRIDIDLASGVASMDLTVMTYNVAGLPWPVKKGRAAALREIAREIETLHASGRAPDIIVLQEAFTPEAARIGAVYANRVRGPGASDKSVTAVPPLAGDFIRERRFGKGERSGKLLSSGLYILSDYPVTASAMTAFAPTSCAGYDCLANKGAMIAVVDIPGAPAPVQILNTHLNSNRKSGVSETRALAAHRQQVTEMGALIASTVNPRWPFIYAGDFNTKRSEARFSHKAKTMPGTLVTHHCLQPASGCDVRMDWTGPAPWLDTQDLQGFAGGHRVAVRPVRAEAMFDEPVNGRALSDHDAYTVTYRLTWKLDAYAGLVAAAAE